MRLAYVDPQSYHGLAKYDAGYLRGLGEVGFEGNIRFYCSSLLDQPVPDKIEVVPVFHYNRKRTAVTKLFAYALSMLRLLAAALSQPADVYHFQWFKFPPVDLICVFVLRRVARARVVFTAHNVVPHGAEEGRHRSLGWLYKAVDHIIVHNASTLDDIARRFSIPRDRLSVLPHGTIDLVSSGIPEHEDRVSDFVENCGTCFLFLGRGSRYKGLDILLEAWPRVDAATKGRPGLIVMGAVDADLKSMAGQAVDKSGGSLLLVDEYVTEADLFHAVRRCDAVVLPHRQISQSGVLLSVLGLGVPVLVSTLPGLLEPFAVAPVGWQFDGTAAGLAEQLEFLADDPRAVSDVRDNHEGWEAVRRAYDWKKIARGSEALYRSLLSRGREN